MKNKTLLIITILFLTIGFAAVSTTLILNGTINIGANENDFDVYFSNAIIDGTEDLSLISQDKKTINFETRNLSKVGDKSILEYEVTNASTQYDANVSVTCAPNETDLYKVINTQDKEIIEARSIGNGTVIVELKKNVLESQKINFTCTINSNALERDSMNDGAISGNCDYPIGTEWNFDYSGDGERFVVPCNGEYKVELWGASGGGGSEPGLANSTYPGLGAYTGGKVILSKNMNIYVYVGAQGNKATSNGTISLSKFDWLEGGFNGGGSAYGLGTGTGGGATDISLIYSNVVLNNEYVYTRSFESLSSRIMVAAGGAGASSHKLENNTSIITKFLGGMGGTLIGGRGYITYGTNALCGASSGCVGLGGTQTGGGTTTNLSGAYVEGKTNYGKFGSGGFGYGRDFHAYYGYTSGGGSGYYGGSGTYGVEGAGGGSSFISGHPGCDAIDEDSTESNIIHTGQPNHYSKLVFIDTKMMAGNEEMPTHDGKGTMVGNKGNGYAKITYLG